MKGIDATAGAPTHSVAHDTKIVRRSTDDEHNEVLSSITPWEICKPGDVVKVGGRIGKVIWRRYADARVIFEGESSITVILVRVPND